jgi:hypothetical protein
MVGDERQTPLEFSRSIELAAVITQYSVVKGSLIIKVCMALMPLILIRIKTNSDYVLQWQ